MKKLHFFTLVVSMLLSISSLSASHVVQEEVQMESKIDKSSHEIHDISEFEELQKKKDSYNFFEVSSMLERSNRANFVQTNWIVCNFLMKGTFDIDIEIENFSKIKEYTNTKKNWHKTTYCLYQLRRLVTYFIGAFQVALGIFFFYWFLKDFLNLPVTGQEAIQDEEEDYS